MRKHVKLWRKMVNSSIYRDVNARLVLFHLMLTSDDEGLVQTSMKILADEVGLSKKQVELALRKLLEKGTIAYMERGRVRGRRQGPNLSTITLCQYSTYQQNGKAKGTKAGTVEGTSIEARAERLISWWNDTIIPKYPGKRAVRLTKDRLSKCGMRFKEDGWAQSLAACADKLPIPNDDRFTWQPDLDWFLANPSNVYKVLEGKYDKETKQKGPKQVDQLVKEVFG